jgi:hypothetical protein
VNLGERAVHAEANHARRARTREMGEGGMMSLEAGACTQGLGKGGKPGSGGTSPDQVSLPSRGQAMVEDTHLWLLLEEWKFSDQASTHQCEIFVTRNYL